MDCSCGVQRGERAAGGPEVNPSSCWLKGKPLNLHFRKPQFPQVKFNKLRIARIATLSFRSFINTIILEVISVLTMSSSHD